MCRVNSFRGMQKGTFPTLFGTACELCGSHRLSSVLVDKSWPSPPDGAGRRFT